MNLCTDCSLCNEAYPMDDASRMNILQSSKNLVNQKLYVFFVESLRSDDVVQVRAHLMVDKINILERGEVRCRREQIEKTNNLEEKRDCGHWLAELIKGNEVQDHNSSTAKDD